MTIGTINYLPRLGPRGPQQTAGYQIDHESGCWIWTGYITKRGYGRIRGGWAHRAAYERLIGPIPVGCDVHHLCRNRACINPDHLELRLMVEHRGRPGTLDTDQLALLWAGIAERIPLDQIADQIGVDRVFLRNIKLKTIYEPKRPRNSE